MFSVMVVDDQKIFRDIVRQLLEEAGDFQVIAEAENGREAIEKVAQMKPDLILMDIDMPVLSGIEATEDILRYHPNTKVILVSMYAEPEFVDAAQRLGALAFIEKKSLTSDAIRKVLQTRS